MRFGRVEFSPGRIPTLATILALAATLSLGQWQLKRAAEKEALRDQYQAMQAEPPVALTGNEAEPQRLRFRPLAAEGEFVTSGQIFLDNQVENERAGYHVLAPLKLAASGRLVLVNRGWIARGAEYPQPPRSDPPEGQVRLRGYGALPVKRFLELAPGTVQGSVWQNLTFERYRLSTGIDVLPIILVQTDDNQPALTPVRQHPDFGIAIHQGYAFQWFALSMAILATFLFRNISRAKE